MINETVKATDNIRVRVYNTEILHWLFPRWYLRSLPRGSREQLTRAHCKVIRDEQTSNTTCVGLYNVIVDLLDSSQSERKPVDAMGVGANSNTPSRSDTEIPDELAQLILTDVSDNGPEIYTRAFISSLELNGEDITNIGVYSSSGHLLNHSQISTISKTESRAVTLEASISFDDVNA